MTSSVICISGADGANADTVANAVGDALGFRVVDEEIVVRAAAEAGVDVGSIVSVEQRKSMLMKILDGVAAAGAAANPDLLAAAQVEIAAASLGDGGLNRPSKELRALIRHAIDDFMAAGDVVILAHAASQSLSGHEQVLRVLVTASPETRSARLAESRQVDTKEGSSLVKKGDAGRADYLKRFYGIDRELPTHYDIVVNTDHVTPQVAAAAIVGMATSSSTAA